MRVKTYSFDDIRKGMDTIKEQYGPDTIIMDIKQNYLDGYGWSKKGCEISIAVEEEPATDQDDLLLELRRGTEAVWQHTTQYLSDRLSSMETEIIRDRLKTYPISLKVLFDKITKSGFNNHLALELVSEVYTEVGHLTENTTKTIFFLKNVLAKRMKTYSIMNSLEPIVVFGPTGAGKTETVKKLSKMASDMGIAASVIAFDPVKQSSYDEMRAFSDATGVPFQFSTSIDDLAVKAGRVKGKLFIDLTGQMDIQKKVMDKLEGLKKIIVFPAGARDDKISYYIKTFQHCNVAGLIFSKLDEEERFGNFCYSVLTLNWPVCFITKGIKLNDIVPYNKETFSRLLIEGAI